MLSVTGRAGATTCAPSRSAARTRTAVAGSTSGHPMSCTRTGVPGLLVASAAATHWARSPGASAVRTGTSENPSAMSSSRTGTTSEEAAPTTTDAACDSP